MIVSILIIYLFSTLMQYGPESAYGGTELQFSEGISVYVWWGNGEWGEVNAKRGQGRNF